MLGFDVERKIDKLEKRIEELEAFVKILKQQGEVKSGYECDPGFLVPSDIVPDDMRGGKKNE